jgi:signal transduction histidine kinase
MNEHNSTASPLMESHSRRLGQLLVLRCLAAVPVFIIAGYLYHTTSSDFSREVIGAIAGSYYLVAILQWLMLRRFGGFGPQLLFQFSTDVILVAALVFITGGFYSPFVFVFGLIVVAAGTQSHVLVVISTAILSCIAYLGTIYGHAWWYQAPLPFDSVLHLLLQTSVLFLVGGVMAAIVQRHAGLQSEQHKVVRQHRRLKELHEQVMASMQEGILILDEQCFVQDSNVAARRILQLGENPGGVSLDAFWPLPRPLVHFFKHPDSDLFQTEWQQTGGSYLVTAARLEEGDPQAAWLVTLVDLSELRLLERKLVEQEKLAAMGRMAAMLAHELRNPMHTISYAVELINTASQDRQTDMQHIIQEEIARLNRLVSDMLDYTQPLEPKPAESDIDELVTASIQQIDISGKLGITASVAMKQLHVDPDHLRLVLDNLLRNATIASPELGSIRVEFSGDYQQWRLTVSDRGEGIPADIRAHIFEPFATGRTKGIGLGLATVRQVCDANGWKIDVDSGSKGTTFTIFGGVEESHGADSAG